MPFLITARYIIAFICLSSAYGSKPELDSRRCTTQLNIEPNMLRGLYMSPYDQTESGVYGNIIVDQAKTDILINFIEKHSINSLSLYDLRHILSDPSLIEHLAHFIRRARKHGVKEVIAIGSTIESFYRIQNYLNTCNDDAGFNGLLTEIEFWAGPEHQQQYKKFVSFLDEMRSLGVQFNGKKLSIHAYLGWLKDSPGSSATEKAREIARLVDRIYLHSYVRRGDQAFPKAKARMYNLVEGNANVDIVPILSAEGPQHHSDMPFQGEYFRTNGIETGEAMYREEFAADPVIAGSNVFLAGFQYYEYRYLGRCLG
ncbi:hypothetical protein SARC_04496 [Sphaeroforma arctica JP610]|uniref:GH18 domain-containing protein n=1 Tax=Sphaeroforma arctica JP610 TaxID=667725 RepID=A0A0L0G313_9EUKA|nr:hypothetical protein SARC_04496 [Sphaeroforma arctica JP610]KNC83239.1 hypothetical protein SARC_04496 [Sphaeroforma arctica JP610]|eukprot:XP_014157141.1 hypothetical protein SARC_04496 [Sphaeroforma arctica JP610]